VVKYKPDYYRLDTLSCGRNISASILMDKRQISSIASKSLASSAYKELKNEDDSLRTPCVSLATVS
jgi:hypothetical protein